MNESDVLYPLARAVLLADTLPDVVDAALASCQVLIPGWRHSVGIIDHEQGTFMVYAAAGPGAPHRPAGRPVPIDQFGADMARLTAGACDVVQNVTERPDAVGGLQGSPLKGQLIAPLRFEGTLIGSLNIGADRIGHFLPEHERRALEIANLVAAALGRVHLRQELAVSLKAATAANRAKSLFLANMSHELRTPLNVILGYTELLTEDADPGVTADLDRVHDAATHLLRVVSDVLDLSKVDSGHLDVATDPIDLSRLALDLEPSLAVQVTAGRNQWQVEAPAPVRALGDAGRVRQIVFNLVSNAARFTTDGHIHLEVGSRQETATLHVVDTGVGIDAEDLPRVFEPFTQVHAPQGSAYGGTGLGLAISRQYARAMGGDLTVSSEVGAGTCFTLTLPLDT